jgi:SAV_6107-like HEPN
MSLPLDLPVPVRRRHTSPVRRSLTLVPSPPPATAVTLLDQARHGLRQAEREADPAERFAQAHLSALRAAAAVLALRGRPHRGRSRPTSVWNLLATMAPELGEWAAFFAAGSATRSAIQAGITRAVTTRAADDLVRQTGQFIDLVERLVRGVAR